MTLFTVTYSVPHDPRLCRRLRSPSTAHYPCDFRLEDAPRLISTSLYSRGHFHTRNPTWFFPNTSSSGCRDLPLTFVESCFPEFESTFNLSGPLENLEGTEGWVTSPVWGLTNDVLKPPAPIPYSKNF